MIESIVLEDGAVRLEPIGPAHVPALVACASREPEIFAWMSTGAMGEPGRLEAFIANAERERSAGTGIGFAVVDRASGAAFGSTSIYRYDAVYGVLEIGRTWYAANARRTAANTTAKRLLFTYAFETLGARRVELRTDTRNTRSRAAIERIGAVYEGTLRRNVVMPDGYIRDTALYAILDLDWPQVRARLDQMLTAWPSSSPPTSNIV